MGITCKELDAACSASKDNDIGQYKYYRSMLELLYPHYKFLESEARILIDLQSEIWAMEAIERDKRIDNILQRNAICYDNESSCQRIEIEVTEKEYKTPFEKVLDFNFFGYNIFFCLEVARTK